jgi:enediyne biosynthesis protein E4
MEMFPPLVTANAAFRNNGDLTFTDAAEEWGFAGKDLSHGACLADLDGDGDLDLVMNNLGSACGIYRNRTAAGRVAVRLEGAGKNRFGVGAKITVRSGSLLQTQEMISGGRYLSSDAPERVFAFPAQATGAIAVRWGNGRTTTVRDVKANHRYVVREED